MKEEVGKKIIDGFHHIMRQEHMTQKDLAEKLHMSEDQMSKVMRNVRDVSNVEMYYLLNQGYSLDSLFSGVYGHPKVEHTSLPVSVEAFVSAIESDYEKLPVEQRRIASVAILKFLIAIIEDYGL